MFNSVRKNRDAHKVGVYTVHLGGGLRSAQGLRVVGDFGHLDIRGSSVVIDMSLSPSPHVAIRSPYSYMQSIILHLTSYILHPTS